MTTQRTPSHATLVGRAFGDLEKLRTKRTKVTSRITADTATVADIDVKIASAQTTFDTLTRGEGDEAAT